MVNGRIARMVRRLEAMGAIPPRSTEPKEEEDVTEQEISRESVPESLAAVPPELIVDVDVRETLRAGGEPFGEIMAARKALPPGGVLRIRAIFEPAPLYFVMAAQGLEHWTEKLAEDDWRVWFFGEAREADDAPASTGTTSPEDDVVVLDVRGLDPPEPMVRTLAALDTLPAGKTLVQINSRVPKFLLPMLQDRGFDYEVREQEPTVVRTFIHRRPE